MEFNKETALLFGVMLGDGCLSHYFSSDGKERFAISITGNYYDDKEFYKNFLSPLLSAVSGRNISIRERPKYGRRDINFCDKDLFYKIKSLGFSVGKKGDIMIPRRFKGPLMRYVIAGLFSTDGCLSLVNNCGKLYPRLFITATLPSALNEASDYLNSIEIKTSFYSRKFRKPSKSYPIKKKQYVLCSNGKNNLEKFRQRVGFINPKHELRYQKYIAYTKKEMAVEGVEPPTSGS